MKLSIFKSTTKDGIFSTDKKYFPNLTHEEIKLLHEVTISKFLNKYNLKDKVLIINDKCLDKAKTITNKTTSNKSKILILKETIKDTIVGVETEDDPVIVATAKDEKNHQVAAISLLTLDNLKNNLLTEIVDKMILETNKAPFEMTFYVGATPSQQYYEIDKSEIDNSIFNNAIIKKRKKYYLDIRLVIFNELQKEIIDPNMMYFDSTDTVESTDYFSKFNNNCGKNLICIKFIDD